MVKEIYWRLLTTAMYFFASSRTVPVSRSRGVVGNTGVDTDFPFVIFVRWRKSAIY